MSLTRIEMKPCNDKIKMTHEEEKSLNDSVLDILTNGLDTVRKPFPNINDVNGEIELPKEDDNINPHSCKP